MSLSPTWVISEEDQKIFGKAVGHDAPSSVLQFKTATIAFITVKDSAGKCLRCPGSFSCLCLNSAPNSAPPSYLPFGCHSELSYPCLQAQQVGVGWILSMMLACYFFRKLGPSYHCDKIVVLCLTSPSFASFDVSSPFGLGSGRSCNTGFR